MMALSIPAAHLQQQIDTQLVLAGLSQCDAIRAMHEDLEKLYRARLVALVLAEKLDSIEQARPAALRRPSRLDGIAAWSVGNPDARDVTQPV